MIETAAPLWLFFSVAALCVVLVGIAKAGFGGGVGVIATPLMSLVVSPLVATGLLLPLLCACDLVALWPYRRTCERRVYWMLLPGALVGIAIASGFLWRLGDHKASAERFMNIVIGLTSILFVVFQLARGMLLHRMEGSPPGGRMGHVLGVVAGFTSTLSHAGGPPVTMFMVPQQLDRRIFVGTTVWIFTTINLVKLVPYGLLGLFSAGNLKVSLMLMPCVPLGVGLGVWLNSRMNQRLFNAIVYTLLVLVGLQLLSGFNPIHWLAGR